MKPRFRTSSWQTDATSHRSRCPKLTWRPEDRPHPVLSNAKYPAAPASRATPRQLSAPSRDPPTSWTYTTQKRRRASSRVLRNFANGRNPPDDGDAPAPPVPAPPPWPSSRQSEHARSPPRSLTTVKSSRRTRLPRNSNAVGPSAVGSNGSRPM